MRPNAAPLAWNAGPGGAAAASTSASLLPPCAASLPAAAAAPAWRHAATRSAALAALAAAALLAGCASGPRGTRIDDPRRDGPEARPPPAQELARVPDAEPRVEPIRAGGPNKPYEVLGQNYVPITQDRPFTERGLASWYGRKFHGRRTASGEPYDMYAMTAAHPTLPIPSYARVRNPANGREVVVRINDRGPFHRGRIVDLSYTAALKLDLLRGVAPVELTRLTFDEIRTGAWRREPDAGEAATRLAAGVPSSAAGAAMAARTADVAVAAAPAGAAPGAVANAAPNTAAPPAPNAAATVVASSTGTAASNAAPNAAANAAATAGANAAADATAPVAAAMPASSMTQPPPASATADAAPPSSAMADAAAASPGATAAAAEPPPARTLAAAQRGFWVQLGAFRERGGAESFQRRVAAELDWLSPLLDVFGDAAVFRLQAGPYASRDEARGVADRVRTALRLVPVVVERR